MNDFNPRSLASVTRQIFALGTVRQSELVQLRKRAIALSKQDVRIQNPASVALVFLGSLRQGVTAEDVLKSDSRTVLRLTRDLEGVIYGDAAQRG